MEMTSRESLEQSGDAMSQSSTRMYFLSIALFWGAIFTACLMDFLRERWFMHHWSAEPDLFTNVLLVLVMALGQIVAGFILLAATIDMIKNSKTVLRALLALALGVSTGAVCFVLYVLFALWFQINVMNRSL